MILINYLKSTILSKFVMAVTGIILVLFIIGHCIGNMQLFIGRESFNSYAYFLQERIGELLWIMRIGLILSLIFHVVTSIRLKFLNLGAKPKKYEVKNYVKAKLTSRTMIWTGIMIFAFVTYHILQFTTGTIYPGDYNRTDYYTTNAMSVKKLGSDECCTKSREATAKDAIINYRGNQYETAGNHPIISERHDAYGMVIHGFRRPIVAILYIIGMILLGFHLNHAIQSAFQTLGYNNPKYFNKIVVGSTVLSTLIVLCFISLPITIIFGLVGGGV